MIKRFSRTYFGQDAEQSFTDEEHADWDGNIDEGIEHESKSYIAFTRAVHGMVFFSKKTQWIVDGALKDTGSNLLSSVGLTLLAAVRVPKMRNQEPHMQEKAKNIKGVGKSIHHLKVYYSIFILESENTQSI